MPDELIDLKRKALALRREILDVCHASGVAAHEGPALSCADIVAALYFKFMRFDPENPTWQSRDRLILSKGHACAVLYGALAMLGVIDRAEYPRFRHADGILQGHPTLNKTPGIDMTAGSLGNGLGIGVGMAYYLRHLEENSRVFVILGDGELNEGTVWEAVMEAPALKLSNLVAIVDLNGLQSSGANRDILPLEPMADKWRAFGWNAIEFNGNDMAEIVPALDRAIHYSYGPSVLLARTVKGRGVSFMENDNAWHQGVLTDGLYAQALDELKEAEKWL